MILNKTMTEFVKEQEKEWNYETIGLENTFKKYKNVVLSQFNYANFLSMPLEKWQFVPSKLVDGKWVVLEEPNKNNTKYQTDFHLEDYFDSMAYEIDLFEFQQAKANVIFEGFEVGTHNHNDCYFEYIDNKQYQMRMYYKDKGSDEWKITDIKLKTIEDLIPYKPTITPEAVKKYQL